MIKPRIASTRLAWAIELGPDTLACVYQWANGLSVPDHAGGYRTATWQTRNKAREALLTVRGRGGRAKYPRIVRVRCDVSIVRGARWKP